MLCGRSVPGRGDVYFFFHIRILTGSRDEATVVRCCVGTCGISEESDRYEYVSYLLFGVAAWGSSRALFSRSLSSEQPLCTHILAYNPALSFSSSSPFAPIYHYRRRHRAYRNRHLRQCRSRVHNKSLIHSRRVRYPSTAYQLPTKQTS